MNNEDETRDYYQDLFYLEKEGLEANCYCSNCNNFNCHNCEDFCNWEES